MTVTQGPALLLIKDDGGEQISFRTIIDYHMGTDNFIARLDILTHKDGVPNKQFNCGIEIKNSAGLPMPKGVEGFSTIISKETLINIFESFVERLKETE